MQECRIRSIMFYEFYQIRRMIADNLVNYKLDYQPKVGLCHYERQTQPYSFPNIDTIKTKNNMIQL